MMVLGWIVVACAAAGFAVGGWNALLFPAVVWIAIALFLVLNDGWYGSGWGDGGVIGHVVIAILSFALTGIGVHVRQRLRRRTGRLS